MQTRRLVVLLYTGWRTAARGEYDGILNVAARRGPGQCRNPLPYCARRSDWRGPAGCRLHCNAKITRVSCLS